MARDQDLVVVPGASAVGRASSSLPRPRNCNLYNDATWATLGEELQRRLTEIYNRKIEFSPEYRRFLDEFVIGNDEGNPDCPHAPNNSDGAVRSIKPWRVFTDPVAQRKLLDMGNKFHRESQRKEWEAMRRGGHLGSGGGDVETLTDEQLGLGSNEFDRYDTGMRLRSGRLVRCWPPPRMEPMEPLPTTDSRCIPQ